MANPYPIEIAQGGVVKLAGALTFTDGANQPLLGGTAAVHGPFTVTHSTASLTAGVSIYTPTVNDILLTAWVEVTTAWNGTTPKADIGQFLSGDTAGWMAATGNNLPNLAAADAPPTTNDEYLAATSTSNYPLAGSPGAGARIAPGRFTGTSPVKVVVSQTGAAGGTAVGGTTGVLNVYLVVASPVTP